MFQPVGMRVDPRPARADAWDGLDEPLRAVWNAVRDLFPAHAMVSQTDTDYLLVAWTLRDGRRARTHFAAPVILHIDSELLLSLWTCDAAERRQIAQSHVETVREGLAGYVPHSRIPTCGVISLCE